MKKAIFIVLSCLLIGFLLFVYVFRVSIYNKFTAHDVKALANLHYYKAGNDQIEKKPTVVFIGNSITQDWQVKRPEFFSSNNYVNRGIGGQNTSQILLRFRQDVINLQPELAVINGGINDLAEPTGYDPDFSFGNLISMAELARANNIRPILTSILPGNNIPHRRDILNVPEKIESMNARIKNYAQANNIPYVDYYSVLVDNERAFNPKYTYDELHPNVEGYKIMEPLVKKAIDEALSLEVGNDLPADLDQ